MGASGLEMAGVILGLYPIITTLAGTYKTLKGSGSSSLNHRAIIASTIYQQTLRGLLASVVKQEDVQQLVDVDPEPQPADQDKISWSDVDLERKLIRRLGEQRFNLVLELLGDLKELLLEVRGELDNMCRGTDVLDRIGVRTRVALLSLPQSRLQENLIKVEALNKDLRQLVDDRPFMVPHQRRRSRAATPDFITTPEHKLQEEAALDFYRTVQKSYTCACQRAHVASVGCHCPACVQIQEPSTALSTHRWEFGLVIPESVVSVSSASPVVWLNPASPETVDSPTVDDLCSLIDEVSVTPSFGEFRDFAGGSKRYRMKVEKGGVSKDRNFQPSESSSKTESWVEVSDDVTASDAHAQADDASSQADFGGDDTTGRASPSRTSGGGGGTACIKSFATLVQRDSGLSTKNRRELALRISYALLRLHRTPWVDRSWNPADVLVSTTQHDVGYDIGFSTIFMPHTFYSICPIADSASVVMTPPPATPVSQLHEIIDDEPVLTRLGFALIELALGKTMEDLGTEYGLQDFNLGHDIADVIVAKKLVKENRVRDEAGSAYQDAVKACISHQYFDRDGNLGCLSTSHESFLTGAHDSILLPLYSVWKTYSGELSPV